MMEIGLLKKKPPKPFVPPPPPSKETGKKKAKDERPNRAAEEKENLPPPPPTKESEMKKTQHNDDYKVPQKRRPLVNRAVKEKENLPPLPPLPRNRRSTARPQSYAFYEMSDEEDVDEPEEQVVNEDDYLYCRSCKAEVQEGCREHPLTFSDGKDLMRIDKSKIEKAGLGAFNGSTSVIPVDTIFGPYTGAETKEKTLPESGFAWAILDSETKRNIVSYVDPGEHPNHKENWLAFVNNANFERDLNIKATQFKGQIFYRVCRPIHPGQELLTHYGDDYAEELNIDKDIFKHGTRWKEF